MATRSTEEEVKKIIDTAFTNEQVTPFLRAANRLITDVLADEEYSDALLTDIECWLAAHFLSAALDPQIKSEKTGDGQWTYHGKSGLGLNFTPYGQQVMMMEHHGVLAQISNSKGSMSIKAMA